MTIQTFLIKERIRKKKYEKVEEYWTREMDQRMIHFRFLF